MTLVSDVQKLQERNVTLIKQVTDLKESDVKRDEQINGERGLAAAIRELSQEMAAGYKELDAKLEQVRVTMRNVGVMVIASSIGFAITVLSVFG